MLQEFLSIQVYVLMMVICRVGGVFMLMPGIGDMYVNKAARLALAVMTSVVLAPFLASSIPPQPPLLSGLLLLIATELFVGVFLGMIARFLISAFDVAGQIFSFQTSLSNAFVFNPVLSQQGSLIGAYITTTAIVMLFIADLHHLILMAMVDSYTLFIPGNLPFIGDFSDTMARVITNSFLLGVQIAAPVLLGGLLFYFAIGLIGRLIPQIQVFFVALPAQIAFGMWLMALSISGGMLWFMKNFQDVLQGYLAP